MHYHVVSMKTSLFHCSALDYAIGVLCHYLSYLKFQCVYSGCHSMVLCRSAMNVDEEQPINVRLWTSGERMYYCS